jgi:predicted dehydrogenase
MRKLGTGLIAAGAAPQILSANNEEIEYLHQRNLRVSANDTIRFAVIGTGIMGHNNLRTALKVPGTEFVAACDLYKGRLKRVQEVYGKEIDTTYNYKDILERDDIDAVIIATSDHWHDHISIDAMNAGKHVYCEKPMVHHISEGKKVVETEQQTGKVMMVGSQRVSSLVDAKAKELYEAGEIGQLVMVESWNDRQSAMGAWQYSIPTDASPKTVKWKDFLGDAPYREFDPVRFFRWRNYQDYGTGVAGDLYVHLFSGLHNILDSYGPNRIYATGGLRYWKDGRDAADVALALFDYPESDAHSAFNMQTRVNFVDGSGGSSKLRLIGSEGVITIGWGEVEVKRRKMASAPGYGGWDSYNTFTEKQQKAYEKWYDKEYAAAKEENLKPTSKTHKAPAGHDDHLTHFTHFFNAIRDNGKVVEDAAFGLRACAPPLASNMSIYENRVIDWDPVKMEMV